MKAWPVILLFLLSFLGPAHAAVPMKWTVQGWYFPEGQGYLEGGFEYNPDTNKFYNITLQSFWVDEHGTMLYHDYARARGTYTPGTDDGVVEFYDYRFIDGLEPTDVYYYLGFSDFDPSQAGTVYFNEYEILETTHYSTGFWGFTRERQGVFGVAYGAPIPEPETYAMMLAGLSMLGFTAKRRSKIARQTA
jgi:hypothetical protein